MKSPYAQAAKRSVRWLRHSFSFLWLIIVAGYLLILAGNAIYRSYSGNQETADLQRQLVDAKVEKERLEAQLVYYKTDSFREKELRRALLLKKPEETMYALPESSTSKTVEEDTAAAVIASDTKKRSPATPFGSNGWPMSGPANDRP